MQYYSILPFVAAVIAAANVVLVLRYRQNPASRPFLVMLLGAVIYSVGQAFELSSAQQDTLIFWDNVQFIPTAMSPAALLLFTLRYCRPHSAVVNGWKLPAALSVHPIIDQAMVWTDPLHNLVRENVRVLSSGGASFLVYDYGLWMWASIALAYLYFLASLLLFMWRFYAASALERRQVLLFVAGVLTPFAGAILTIFGLVPFVGVSGLDLTPITLTGANLFFSAALFGARLLDLSPVARDRVFALMHEGAIVLDLLNHRILDWNAAAGILLGPYLRKPLAEGLPLAEALPELERFVNQKRTGLLSLSDENLQVELNVLCAPVRDIRGVEQGIVVTLHDITAFKRIQQELELARSRAEDASAAKSRFLAHMSHEIRTPMTAILGAAELLSESPLNDEQRELTHIFANAGVDLQRMLNEVLDIARIEAGRVAIDIRPLDLHRLLHELEASFTAQCARSEIRFRLQIDPTTPQQIRSDAGRLKQILGNLLTNAIKHARRGLVQLQVAPIGSVDHSIRLRFQVLDEGPGIPTDALELIFDAFQQGPRPGNAPTDGAGLGLSISRQLARLLGGEITAANRKEGGACFEFTMLAEAAEEQRPSPASSAMPAPRSGLRILLAEDSATNQMLVQRFLAPYDLQLQIAADGRAALQKFQEERFDLVLMDIQMPEMDGYACTRAMRRYESQAMIARTPIVALTAYTMEEERLEAIRAGMDGHIAKPISRAQLVESIVRFTAAEI